MKNKILTISIIFILLSFIFINNNVFAASYDLSDYKNKVGSNSYLIAYDEDSENFYLFVSRRSGTKYFICGISPDENHLTYRIHCSGSYGSWQQSQCFFDVYIFDKVSNTFIYDNCYNPFEFDFNLLPIASNTNVYIWENTTPFFQITPVPLPVVMGQTILAEKLEKVEMKEPIITTIVGLAKLLIPFLICLIGFWKAWRLLSKTLYKG